MSNESVNVSWAFCPCGFRRFYIPQDQISGYSKLKRKLLYDKARKDAKQKGWKLLSAVTENCPGCGEKFEHEHRTEQD